MDVTGSGVEGPDSGPRGGGGLDATLGTGAGELPCARAYLHGSVVALWEIQPCLETVPTGTKALGL